MTSRALPSLLESVLVHLSQATLFGLAIAGLLLALPFVAARLRHILGWIGLAKFALPLTAFGFALPATAPAFLSGQWLPALFVADRGAGKVMETPSASLFPLVFVLVWASGTVLLATLTLVRALRFSRQLRADRTPFSAEEAHSLASLARRAGVNPARVEGWTTPAGVAPGVSGIFRSRIHVPRELLHVLTRDETEAVLLHELAHIARRDNLWRLLQAGIVCLGWFHPLVWWLHRRLILESERACDETVVSLTRDREAYAQGLLKAARFALGLTVPGFSGMARHGLKTRLVALLNPTTQKDHPMLRLTLISLALAGFAFTAGASSPAESASDIYSIEQLDTKPVPTFQARPVYPSAFRYTGTEGEAVIVFVVDATGAVTQPTVLRSTHKEFESPSLEAVSQWIFQPGMKDGHPVATRLTVPIVYKRNN